MRFNQVNKNDGDVNNVFSEAGPVVQAVGTAGAVSTAASSHGPAAQTAGQTGDVSVEPPEESFWSQAFTKLKALWK